MSEALTLIGIVVGSSAFGIVFAEASGIMNSTKKLLCDLGIWYKEVPNPNLGNVSHYSALKPIKIPRRLKPFDCHLCMSFWVCLCLCLFYLHLPVIDSILTAATSCLFSVWVWKQIKP